MADSSLTPASPPGLVVLGHGPLAQIIAEVLAGQTATGGASVTQLVPPNPTPSAALLCPLPELNALPARADLPQAAPTQLFATPASLQRQGDSLLITLADGTTLVAAQLVIASSRWAAKLLPGLGLALPLRPVRAHQLEFIGTNPQHILPAPKAENLGYGTVVAHSAAASTILVYDGLADPVQATFDTQPDARVTAALEQWLTSNLPGFTDAPLPPPVVTALPLATTPDYLPALGPWPGVPGLWLATGLAGWGPTLAPALAGLFATTFRGQSWPASLAFVNPARFRDGDATPVQRPAWLVERQPVVITPQFAQTVRLTGGRAQSVNNDAAINMVGSTLQNANADNTVHLTGSSMADVANTVNFKQGKTIQRAGEANEDGSVGRPLVDKSKPRMAPVARKK